jgi:Protein of unknown function (DUF3501)
MTTKTMPQITRESLMSLEAYAKARPEFRARAIAHKRLRTVQIGEHVSLFFEDEFTIRYQIQEVLRVEKQFEEDGILEELHAYNPLIPGGRDFKATMMIEYADEAERRIALTKLKGIEDKTWIQVEGSRRVYAIADEDLQRENETKTSAVHFLRFPLAKEMAEALKYGVSLSMGIDHENYNAAVEPIAIETRNALVKDLA